jgi:hypothetical protein
MPVPNFSPGEILTAGAMDAIGLWKITTVTMTNSLTNIANCFSSNYENYLVTINYTATSANQFVGFQFSNGGTPVNLGNYKYAFQTTTAGGVASSLASTSNTGVVLGFTGTASPNGSSIVTIFQPNISGRTYGSQQRYEFDSATFNSRQGMFVYDAITAFDGLTIITGGSNIGATITIYGYQK